MFSQEPRCRYGKNQLAEVICQLRFPEILTIETNVPAEFQEMIRDTFPHYSVRKEAAAPTLSGAPGNYSLQSGPQNNNYQFISADGVWKINLTSKFLSLSCSRYSSWEEFALMLDGPLAALIQVYHPAMFTRVGLRYLNFVSRKSLQLENTAFRELFESPYMGILADEQLAESAVARCSMDTEFAIRNACRCKLHAGPGLIKRNGQQDNEVKFILDLDLYMEGNVPVKVSAGALEMLHSQAFPIFRGAITDTLHEAMLPERI